MVNIPPFCARAAPFSFATTYQNKAFENVSIKCYGQCDQRFNKIAKYISPKNRTLNSIHIFIILCWVGIFRNCYIFLSFHCFTTIQYNIIMPNFVQFQIVDGLFSVGRYNYDLIKNRTVKKIRKRNEYAIL